MEEGRNSDETRAGVRRYLGGGHEIPKRYRLISIYRGV
jgi:hypothetical protein